MSNDVFVRIVLDARAFNEALSQVSAAFKRASYVMAQTPWGVEAKRRALLARRKPQRPAYPASRHRR